MDTVNFYKNVSETIRLYHDPSLKEVWHFHTNGEENVIRFGSKHYGWILIQMDAGFHCVCRVIDNEFKSLDRETISIIKASAAETRVNIALRNFDDINGLYFFGHHSQKFEDMFTLIRSQYDVRTDYAVFCACNRDPLNSFSVTIDAAAGTITAWRIVPTMIDSTNDLELYLNFNKLSYLPFKYNRWAIMSQFYDFLDMKDKVISTVLLEKDIEEKLIKSKKKPKKLMDETEISRFNIVQKKINKLNFACKGYVIGDIHVFISERIVYIYDELGVKRFYQSSMLRSS